MSSNALRQSGVFLNLRFINKPQVQVKIGDKPPHFDAETGDLHASSTWHPKIKDLVEELVKWTLLLKHLDTKF